MRVGYFEYGIRGLLYDVGLWVVVLVDAVVEVHELVFVGFYVGDERWYVVDVVDFGEYVDYGFVGVVMEWVV